jgi:hypothetical protein
MRKSLVNVFSLYAPEQLSKTELLLLGEVIPNSLQGIEKVATPLAFVVAVVMVPPALYFTSKTTPDAATESIPMLLFKMPDLSSSYNFTENVAA